MGPLTDVSVCSHLCTGTRTQGSTPNYNSTDGNDLRNCFLFSIPSRRQVTKTKSLDSQEAAIYGWSWRSSIIFSRTKSLHAQNKLQAYVLIYVGGVAAICWWSSNDDVVDIGSSGASPSSHDIKMVSSHICLTICVRPKWSRHTYG